MRRSGNSVVEIVVALTLAALVLAMATGSLLRQQRTAISMRAVADASGQRRMAMALLPAHIGLAAPGAEDLAPGMLRDTALQLRVAVATAITCARAVEPSIPLDDRDTLPTTGILSPPRRGDSLWWYQSDSARWVGRGLGDVSTGLGPCPARVAIAGAGAGRVMHLPVDGGDTVPALAPLRITRQVRVVLYRAGDGTWQLGYREWNDAARSMAAPQPVAGPFLRIAPDGARTGFRYYDAAGRELPPDVDASASTRVARVRFTAISPSYPSASGAPAAAARDSADVVIRPHPPD